MRKKQAADHADDKVPGGLASSAFHEGRSGCRRRSLRAHQTLGDAVTTWIRLYTHSGPQWRDQKCTFDADGALYISSRQDLGIRLNTANHMEIMATQPAQPACT